MAITPVRLRKVITGTKQKYFDLEVLGTDDEGNEIVIGRRLYIANIEKNSNNVKEILELGENTPPSQLTNTCNVFSSAGGVKDLVIRNMFEVTNNPDFETRSYAYANRADLEFNKADDYSDLFIDNRYQVSSVVGFNDSVFTLTNQLSSVTYYPLDYITKNNTLSTAIIRDPLFTAIFDSVSALENLSTSEFDKQFVPKYLINGLRYNNVVDYPMSVYPLFKDNTLLGNAIICKNHLGYDYCQHSIENKLGEDLATREFTEMRSYKRLISSGDKIYLVYDNKYYIDDPNKTIETVPYINNTNNTDIIVNIGGTEDYDPSFPFPDIIYPEQTPNEPSYPPDDEEDEPYIPEPEEPDPTIDMSNYTTVIYNNGWRNNSYLIQGELTPRSITNIKDVIFKVIIGKTVTSIGDYAFQNCKNLTSVTIPDSVTSIGSYAFYQCYSLTEITLPPTLTYIKTAAFYHCVNLTSVTIPGGVKAIGSLAFRGCTGLTSVTIWIGVTSIGGDAFYGCSGLTSVTIPSSVTSIGSYVFSGCSGLTSVTIPSSVKTISNSAFRDCSRLTSVTIPEGVTSIGEGAFEGCRSLTSVTIPEGVTSIGRYAFYGCSGLTSVTIPASMAKPSWVTEDTVGEGAFRDCTSLLEIYFNGSYPSVGKLAFKTYGLVKPIGYYKSEYKDDWIKILLRVNDEGEGYWYSGGIDVKPSPNTTTYSLRSSRNTNTRAGKPTLDLNAIEKVEQFNSVNRFTQTNRHKSNLYSIEIEDLGLNSIEKNADEKIKSAVKNIKKSITNNIKKICQNTQPGNTQLFSVFFTGN